MWKKILMAIALRLLDMLWDIVDSDGDGYLSRQEIKESYNGAKTRLRKLYEHMF
jgi:hypothetical protein